MTQGTDLILVFPAIFSKKIGFMNIGKKAKFTDSKPKTLLMNLSEDYL